MSHCVIFLCLYILTYLVLTLGGGYRFMMSGHTRPAGLAMGDTFYWQPYWGEFHPFRTALGEDEYRGDIIGHLLCPLILLDQKLWHKSIVSLQEDLDRPRKIPVPPFQNIHPFTKQIWAIADRFDSGMRKARVEKDWATSDRLFEAEIVEFTRLAKKRFIISHISLFIYIVLMSLLVTKLQQHLERFRSKHTKVDNQA